MVGHESSTSRLGPFSFEGMDSGLPEDELSCMQLTIDDHAWNQLAVRQ